VQKKKNSNKWFIDKDSKYRWIYHGIKRNVVSAKTKFQHVEIIDTYNFGRVVILDDKIQSSEADEFVYHEALVHPAMVIHPKPENVLILGGGEGSTLREVLKHPTVRRVTMIDIDKEFVSFCKRYLRKWHQGSFDDPRVELIYGDALEYVKNGTTQFDIVISDISDPIKKSPAVSSYTKKFYSLIKKILMPDGIFVTHVTEVDYAPQRNFSITIFKILKEIFPEARLYFEYIPSYGTLWAFTIGPLKYSPNISRAAMDRRLRERGLENLLYYDTETHERLFRLPRCIRSLMTA